MTCPGFFPIFRPILHRMDAELAHTLTIRTLAAGLYPKDNKPDDPRLAQTVFGMRFTNPVGMAAGFDKNAEALPALFAMGFGFVEAGTVTPLPQKGNPKPRIFRDIESRSVINRMGFPGRGAKAVLRNLSKFRAQNDGFGGIVGINIGKNKDTEDPAADYLTLVDRFAPLADYLTINVSSPNTPGLRDLQKRDFLLPLIEAVKDRRGIACGDNRHPPILIKLAPDLSDFQISELSKTLIEGGVDGIILCNTTTDRPTTLPEAFRKELGGLSGPHLRQKSTVAIRRFYEETEGKLPIIGVGGINSAEDAYAKIKAGASLIQLYTALVFNGPAMINCMKEALIKKLDEDGLKTIGQAVGLDHK